MRTIVEIRFGSHLYGTATPQSDLDIKAVYLPTERDILLQRVRPSVTRIRAKVPGEKNTADDIDFEAYSPAKFLQLLADGQTVALDILFSPDTVMIKAPDPLWRDIQALAPRLFSRRSTAFISYCRQQTQKYAVKGTRLAAVRLALDGLIAAELRYGGNARLSEAQAEVEAMCVGSELLALVELPNANGGSAVYFDIAGKKAIVSASIKAARAMAQKLFDEFGERTRMAESQQGVDWKAMMHAVRIAGQAVEFLTTRRVTFPRPNAAHLLAIRHGQLSYDAVSDEIEQLLAEVESAVENSDLPETAKEGLADDFIADLHMRIVRGEL